MISACCMFPYRCFNAMLTEATIADTRNQMLVSPATFSLEASFDIWKLERAGHFTML